MTAVASLLVAFLVYVVIRYTPIIGRIFEEKPLFLPLRVPPAGDDGATAGGDSGAVERVGV